MLVSSGCCPRSELVESSWWVGTSGRGCVRVLVGLGVLEEKGCVWVEERRCSDRLWGAGPLHPS